MLPGISGKPPDKPVGNVPTLVGCQLVVGKAMSHHDAWTTVAQHLKNFITEYGTKKQARAELGLPRPNTDAYTRRVRMASPVILKPLPITEAQSVPMALLLNTPFADATSTVPIRDEFMDYIRSKGFTRVIP